MATARPSPPQPISPMLIVSLGPGSAAPWACGCAPIQVRCRSGSGRSQEVTPSRIRGHGRSPWCVFDAPDAACSRSESRAAVAERGLNGVAVSATDQVPSGGRDLPQTRPLAKAKVFVYNVPNKARTTSRSSEAMRYLPTFFVAALLAACLSETATPAEPADGYRAGCRPRPRSCRGGAGSICWRNSLLGSGESRSSRTTSA